MRTAAFASRSFRSGTQIAHVVDDGDPRPFGDRVAGAESPRSHESQPMSTAAAARGISAYTKANWSAVRFASALVWSVALE
jgi:hypothetical protein